MVIKHHKDDEEQLKLTDMLIDVLNPIEVLDVGCGMGWKYPCFTTTKYIGVDKNRNHLRHFDGTRIICRGEHLPFPDRSFDLVYSCTVLMLNKDGEKIINEMARVSANYLAFIESRRKLMYGHKHPYKEISERNGFELVFERKFETERSPLSMWLFRRNEIGNNKN